MRTPVEIQHVQSKEDLGRVGKGWAERDRALPVLPGSTSSGGDVLGTKPPRRNAFLVGRDGDPRDATLGELRVGPGLHVEREAANGHVRGVHLDAAVGGLVDVQGGEGDEHLGRRRAGVRAIKDNRLSCAHILGGERAVPEVLVIGRKQEPGDTRGVLDRVGPGLEVEHGLAGEDGLDHGPDP